MQQVLQIRSSNNGISQLRVASDHALLSIEFAYTVDKFSLHHTLVQRLLRLTIKINNRVETLVGLLHNPHAFTSPVDEVVAWGEDTWP
jgi:hypothetical protein